MSLHILKRESATDLLKNCTISTCDISTSYFYYRPTFDTNVGLLVLFALCLISLIYVYFKHGRRASAFHFALGTGCILEVLGYIGRLMGWKNPWGEQGFLLQIICLTIAPAFMAGGIYLCLRRIVYAFGAENSRIRPETFTRVFVPCDVVSLILQALGGGMASQAAHEGKSPKLGDDIMLAGLGFQVLTLAIFMAVCLDFAIRTHRRNKQLPSGSLDPEYAALRATRKFRGFLVSLTIATICIFVRSVYRVAELADGWTGELIRQQWLFVGLEGFMVIVAVFVLCLFNPAVCFKEGFEGSGGMTGIWGFRKTKHTSPDDVEK